MQSDSLLTNRKAPPVKSHLSVNLDAGPLLPVLTCKLCLMANIMCGGDLFIFNIYLFVQGAWVLTAGEIRRHN